MNVIRKRRGKYKLRKHYLTPTALLKKLEDITSEPANVNIYIKDPVLGVRFVARVDKNFFNSSPVFIVES